MIYNFIADETRTEPLMKLHQLRQQSKKPAGQFNRCLADYVADKASGVDDYVGAFRGIGRFWRRRR